MIAEEIAIHRCREYTLESLRSLRRSRMTARRALLPNSGIVTHHCEKHGVLGEPTWLEDAVAFISGGGEVLALQDEVAKLHAKVDGLESKAKDLAALAAQVHVTPFWIPL